MKTAVGRELIVTNAYIKIRTIQINNLMMHLRAWGWGGRMSQIQNQ